MEDYFWLRLAPLAAILSSFTTDLGTEFLHRYYTLQFVGGDWNMNDYATLYQIDLRIGKMTGTVTAEKHEIRSVTGCYHPNSIM
jgi:hypothetical protein